MTDTKHSATTRAIERIISGGLNMGWISDAEASGIRAAIAAAAPMQSPYESAMNACISYLIHGDADFSDSPNDGLTSYFKERADKIRAAAPKAALTDAPWWLKDKIVAYASSKEGCANKVISKAQFDNALPKNRTEFDVPLGRLDASGPNAALETALEQLVEHCDNVGTCGMAIEDARAALAAAGVSHG